MVQIGHDDHRSEQDEAVDEVAEGQRQEVVGLIRRARDVEKEHQVAAHLRDGGPRRAGPFGVSSGTGQYRLRESSI